VMGAIRAHFPPEFINRVDEIIIFVSNISHGTIKKLMLMTSLAHTFSEKHYAYCRPASERGRGPPLRP
jgi:ATP-dependent Clp protease ATP-binding subunit ClpA